MDEDSYKAPNQRNKIGKKGSKQNTEHIKIDLEFDIRSSSERDANSPHNHSEVGIKNSSTGGTNDK